MSPSIVQFNPHPRFHEALPQDQKPKLTVDTGRGADPTLGRLFGVKLVNTGKVPITVTEIYLLLGKDEEGNEIRAYPPSFSLGSTGGSSLPCKLEAGDPASFNTPLNQLQNDLRSHGFDNEAKITLIAKDSLNNTYEKKDRVTLG